jgi:hypothetical protein
MATLNQLRKQALDLLVEYETLRQALGNLSVEALGQPAITRELLRRRGEIRTLLVAVNAQLP